MAKWVDMAKEGSRIDFQTPPDVCKYMVSMMPSWTKTVLEPTPGEGNIVAALRKMGNGTAHGYRITAPDDYFKLDPSISFDCVVMNPPFSSKTAFGVPDGFEKHGMRLGYHILEECMQKSDNVIALMPWFTITDSDVRLRAIKKFGLMSITALPRKTFQYSRIQTCIFQMKRGWEKETIFRTFDF